MSDPSGRRNRLDRLRSVAEEALSASGAGDKFADKLWEVLEQLQAENEELQRSRDEVERLHRQFVDLYEFAPVGYLLLNEKRIIVQANETARRFLGSERLYAERIGLGVVIDEECQDQYFKALRGCRESGEPATAEICIDREEGYLWLQARITCDSDGEATVSGYRITLTDISDRVAAQQNAEERRLEVEKLLEEKELLLREIHHRVKNDFHLVSSFLSLQGASSGNPEVKAAMEEARSRVSVMTQIYQALHRQSQYSEVDARTVVGELINGFKSGVAGRNVEVRRELESVQVPTGTSLSLGLIFNEILTNASKYAFSDVDQPALSVSLRSVNGEMLELEVTDNGRGLPNAVVNGQSRGFGLSVAEAMAQQHRGSLSVENDQGAVVRVRMRLG